MSKKLIVLLAFFMAFSIVKAELSYQGTSPSAEQNNGISAKYPLNKLTPTSVTFNVNMSVQVANSSFDPATGHVYLAGSMTDWASNQLEMTDTDGDKIYSVTVANLEQGTTVYFKFRANDGWENDPNREYVVILEGSYTDYYNRDLGGGITIPTTFICNVELEIIAGRFNPSTDILTTRGTFNSWADSDTMTASLSDPNVYELTKNVAVLEGDVIAYKYAYVSGTVTTWENGDNYEYTVTNADINNGYIIIGHAFNNSDLSTVTHQPTTVRFAVDMRNAVNAVTNQLFTTIEKVAVLGSVTPLAWPQSGWPDSDEGLAIFLNDSGVDGDQVAGDGYWTKEITFPIYTSLYFEYKYGANWGLASNGGSNDNESTTGDNHKILLTTNAQYVAIDDLWSDMLHIHPSVEETDEEIPTVYNLSQNYPNPFNPSTTINFSVPEAGLVTLRVFNVLGQEVANLVNEDLATGNYNVNFNASNLTSGVYFYSITSNNFVATKKMMLVK